VRPKKSAAAGIAAVVACQLLSTAHFALAQTGGTCVPVTERNGREFGCFITAREILSSLPKAPVYWHIDVFPNRAAAEAAKGPNSTVVDSLGKIWLFTIAGADWRSSGGNAVANIGPLPLVKADQIAATYMEGVFEPGMASEVHRHPGTETWYTLEGEMCVETPEGKQVQRAAGPNVIVPAGLPMELIGTGRSVRRSLVLILQDASKPRSVHADDWKPTGLCK
jgi:quercetin dioxygenase-like cupin family protein